MPVQYPTGIIAEHLATRSGAGLFDVSHMGRFVLRGPGAAAFLQHVLTNNAEALDLLQAQYTMVPTETGGAVDDAYLYRFVDGEYLLVVNASNRHKDWDHFREHLAHFPDVEMSDETGEIAMVAAAGQGVARHPRRPDRGGRAAGAAAQRAEPRHPAAAATDASPRRASPAPATPASPSRSSSSWPRTTGRPSGTRWSARAPCPSASAPATPCGSRPACPLYGHELGVDPEGDEIPIFSCPLATFAVSFSPRKGDFIGRHALREAAARLRAHPAARLLPARGPAAAHAAGGRDRPRHRPRGSAGARGGRRDATAARPSSGGSRAARPCRTGASRARASAPLRPRSTSFAPSPSPTSTAASLEDDEVEVDVRGRRVPGLVVPAPPAQRRPALRARHHLGLHAAAHRARGRRGRREGAPPAGQGDRQPRVAPAGVHRPHPERDDRRRRRRACSASPTRRDATPSTRRRRPSTTPTSSTTRAPGFIHEVERLLVNEFRAYLGCPEVETRTVSGQMANTAVFSALVDYLNRADRKARAAAHRQGRQQPHRQGRPPLSAQPMGALRDYVARDPRTELPAVVDIPVLRGEPVQGGRRRRSST